MTPFVQDPDLTIHVGHVRDVLRELPDGSVDCVITSPPYWGLRDYGTGQWEGGDPDCDHLGAPFRTKSKLNENWGAGFSDAEGREPMGQTCSKCGARRKDQQLGLEPTPEAYVQNMVAVFREVRRVLADHGTCWVNLGDSYNAQQAGNKTPSGFSQTRPSRVSGNGDQETVKTGRGLVADLKPKDLVGIPWRVAFALQADGWYLRADIIWAKPNPMPESVTDRPTKAHEFVFLLSKRPRYWFDQEAVREPHTPDGRRKTVHDHATDNSHPYGLVMPALAFSTPPVLVRRCLLAGCPEWVCGVCGKPRERLTKMERHGAGHTGLEARGRSPGWRKRPPDEVVTMGWSDCGHDAYRPGIVLDPFGGSGTTAVVARRFSRHAILIELNPDYARMAAKRLSQLSLLAEGAA